MSGAGDPQGAAVGRRWRHGLLLAIAIGSLAAILSFDPIGQGQEYHDFADKRTSLEIPNVWDVVSNLPFLLVGLAGVRFCVMTGSLSQRPSWLTVFVGVAMVSAGSAYYHWSPTDATLVWDRLPMAVGFAGMFVALLAEYVDARLGRYLLAPAILLGIGSVLYWYGFDDLRVYIWVQAIPLLTIPVVMVLFRSRYTHQWLLGAALVWYVLAKLTEILDRQVFELTGQFFSGHSLKHLLAALGCFSILAMLRVRKPVGDGPDARPASTSTDCSWQ